MKTLEDVSLSEFSWFKSGGTAKKILFPETVAEFVSVQHSLLRGRVPFKVIGETSNLLFLDDVCYDTLVSTTALKGLHYDSAKQEIEVEAGFLLPELSRYALRQSIAGFSGFEGIPGTVGGAVFMNAGAYGTTVEGLLKRVEVALPGGGVQVLQKDDLKFGYRSSVFKTGKHPGIIFRAVFRATPGDQTAEYRRMEEIHASRHRQFEYMYPNLGSIFAGSIYRSLGKRDKFFAVAAALFYFYNYRFRPFGRQTPINRKWLNDLAVKRFGIRYRIQPFSDKSLNVLVNNGHHTDELVAYIESMRELIGNEVPIENEIVRPF